MKLVRAMATVGGMTILSRLFGFARDILTAAFLGAGPAADAFFVALKLPNFFRRITAEGAFSVSFVPIFSDELARNGEEEAKNFAENAQAVMIAILVPFSMIVMLAMPWVIYLIAPGFGGDADPTRYDLAVELSRITFPYLLMMSLVALMGGVLNSLDSFAPFAVAPVFFNACLILALLVLTPYLETAGHAMAWGVVAAGVVQLLWMIWACWRKGFVLRLRRPKLTVRIRRLFRLMGPGVFGAGVVQINLFVDIFLASLLPAGAISYLYYADRLYQLPLSVVGIAIGTALLPMLTREISSGNKKEAVGLFSKSLEYSLLLSLPSAVALIALAYPIMSTLFERGAFDAEASRASAWTLAAYAFGLPCFISIKILNTAFYARENTKTPVKYAMISVATNIVFGLLLIKPFAQAGIALGTSLSSWLHVVMLSRSLYRRGFLQVEQRFFSRLGRIAFSAAVMGAVIGFLAWKLFGAFIEGPQLCRISVLLLLIAMGCGVYGYFIHRLGVLHLRDLKLLVKKADKVEAEIAKES